jgi:hypothetical protein
LESAVVHGQRRAPCRRIATHKVHRLGHRRLGAVGSGAGPLVWYTTALAAFHRTGRSTRWCRLRWLQMQLRHAVWGSRIHDGRLGGGLQGRG